MTVPFSEEPLLGKRQTGEDELPLREDPLPSKMVRVVDSMGIYTDYLAQVESLKKEGGGFLSLTGTQKAAFDKQATKVLQASSRMYQKSVAYILPACTFAVYQSITGIDQAKMSEQYILAIIPPVAKIIAADTYTLYEKAVADENNQNIDNTQVKDMASKIHELQLESTLQKGQKTTFCTYHCRFKVSEEDIEKIKEGKQPLGLKCKVITWLDKAATASTPPPSKEGENETIKAPQDYTFRYKFAEIEPIYEENVYLNEVSKMVRFRNVIGQHVIKTNAIKKVF